MTTFGAPFSLLRPSVRRCGGNQASPQFYKDAGASTTRHGFAAPNGLTSIPGRGQEVRASSLSSSLCLCASVRDFPLFCHPELAKDLTAGQPASGHHSPFSKLTTPPGEPSVPTTCRLKRTSGSPREILRKLRMTTFGALFSLLRPSVRRCGGNQASPQFYKDAGASTTRHGFAAPNGLTSIPGRGQEVRVSSLSSSLCLCVSVRDFPCNGGCRLRPNG